MSTELSALRHLLSVCQQHVAGVAFRLHDGEGWATEYTQTPQDIIAAANSTGQDNLYLFNDSGERLGRFWLVWGNDPSGDELAADYSDTPLLNAIWEQWQDMFA